MTILKSKTACRYCPWRRDSARGWLGNSTPEDFLAQCLSEEHMPCHISIDYDDLNWRDVLEESPHCAGSLIFMKNSCKMPRDPKLSEMHKEVTTSEEIFSFGPEFLKHHGGE